MSGLERATCLAQGVYFFVTGAWPLVSISTFQAVTGPKTDLWLVKTVGLLILVIAAVLLTAAYLDRTTPETRVAAVGSALVLAAVDVTYSLSGVISPIYLGDAVLEAVFVAGWTAGAMRYRR